MKASKILIGLFLIVLAVFLILDALGVTRPLDSIVGDVSFWQIVGGIALLSVAMTSLFKGRIEEIFIPLALVFMIFERNIAFIAGAPEENLINNGIVLLCAVLVSIGLTMILPTRRFVLIKKWKKTPQEGDIIVENSTPAFENKLKGSEKYIDCADFSYQAVSNHLGSIDLYFENTDAYKGGGILYVENHLGSVEIHVPSNWCVRCELDNSLGNVDTEGSSDKTGPTLTVKGENHLGNISISYE